jgi:hypothetical protein
MYADKFHSKTDPPVFLTADAYESFVKRFGPGQEATFAALRARFSEPDLTPFAAAYGYGFARPARTRSPAGRTPAASNSPASPAL